MKSEVARLLAQISAEYEAAERGFRGLALGTARHDFITARMECICQLHTELRALVGNDAMTLVTQQLERPFESSEPAAPENDTGR